MMKKESAERVQKFLLEQQLPDVKVKGRGNDKKNDAAMLISAVDHVTQVALETCRCSHLQEYFPHLLDLELCKANHHPRGWVVANPVHSLHVTSQLEDASPASQHWKQPPILYGEEQQRTIALNTEGIVEYWCPLDGYSAVIHDDTALEKMEHLPTVHKQKPSHPPYLGPATRQGTTAHSSSSTSKNPHSKQHPPKPKPADKVPSLVDSLTVKTAEGSNEASTNTAATPNAVPSSTADSAGGSPIKIDQPPVVPSSPAAALPVPPKSGSASEKAESPPVEVTSSGSAIAASSGQAEPETFPDADFNHLRLEEDRIRLIRRSLSSHRLEQKKKIDPKTKKRKRVADLKSSPGIPGWRPSDPKELSNEQEDEWKDALVSAREKVERWMNNYRLSRQSYWDEKLSKEEDHRNKKARSSFYLPVDPADSARCCVVCKNKKTDRCWDGKGAQKLSFRRMEGDSLMQCLECSLIACSPQSINPHSRQHMLQHLLVSGHKFGKK